MQNTNNLIFENTFKDLEVNLADQKEKLDFYSYLNDGISNQLNREVLIKVNPKNDNLEYKIEKLKQEMKNLNNSLNLNGYFMMGDLFNMDIVSVEQTLKCIHSLFNQRQNDQIFRREILEKHKVFESEKIILTQQNERLNQYKSQQMNQINDLQQKIKLIDAQSKENMDKIKDEKEEFQRLYLKILNREQQYQHELRKKDSSYKQLQDQFKRIQMDKINYKNSFEMTCELEKNGPQLFTQDGNYEFAQMITKTQKQIQDSLIKENNSLRSTLQDLFNELHDIIKHRNDFYIKRKHIEMGDISDETLVDELDAQLVHFKQNLIMLPLEKTGKEAYLVMQENLKKFKFLMQKLDEKQKNLDDVSDLQENQREIEKFQSVRGLNDLIKNYECIINAQDQMMNKAIIKANSVKEVSDINFEVNKIGKIMDDNEINRARDFLQQQKKYLENRSNQLEDSKILLSQTTQKIHAEKEIIKQKRNEQQQQLQKFKENIENLCLKNKQIFESC